MRESKVCVLGDFAAGRPVLTSCVLAFGFMALAATGYRNAPAFFASVSYSAIAALAVMVIAPAAIASVAPRNFWLRLFYSGVAAGLMLAVRRIAVQSGFDLGAFRLDAALAGAAAATLMLALGAPLWRGSLRLSLVGLCAIVLGATGGLSIIALEAARTGAVHAAGAALGFASAAGAAVSVHLASGYASAFALGANGADAAGRAARGVVAQGLFALALGPVALGAGAFIVDAPPGTAAIVGAGVLAASLGAAILLGVGALSLKTPSEAIAGDENRRRSELRPFLQIVRAIAPPSSSIAVSAILLIATVAAAFDVASVATIVEIAVIGAAFAAAMLIFVSVRTALLLVLLLIISTRLSIWGADRIFGEAPGENVRVIAAALAAVLLSRLALAWRDNRNPRRKALDVTQRALAEGLSGYGAASILAIAALASAGAGGLWDAGSQAAVFLAAVVAIGALSAPALMTAVGALFGRE
jgi:hypothetical protein